MQEQAVERGDSWLLCSDGLNDMVKDDDIHISLGSYGADLNAISSQLVKMANDNGGKDNISVVLAEVVDSFPARSGIISQILQRFS